MLYINIYYEQVDIDMPNLMLSASACYLIRLTFCYLRISSSKFLIFLAYLCSS